MTPDLRPYVVLLSALLSNRLDANEFQAVFVALFKSDQLWRPEEVFEVLNEIFLEAEAFAPATTGAPYAVSEAQLLSTAKRGLKRLKEVVDPA